MGTVLKNKNFCCMDCGDLIRPDTALYGQGRCKSCANMGENNPHYGKSSKLDNHKDSCSCMICKAKNKKQSGSDNPFYGKSHREDAKTKIGDSTKQRLANPTYVERWKRALPIRRGKDNPNYGKISHGKWGTYKDCRMRSSWEISYAKWLDLNNIKWEYEKKVFDLGDTTYRPDFYLPETDEYIEVKGYWREDAKEKFDTLKLMYPEIKVRVLEGRDLVSIGITSIKL